MILGQFETFDKLNLYSYLSAIRCPQPSFYMWAAAWLLSCALHCSNYI